MDAITLPFGNYKSVPLDEIPLGYLRWALSEAALDSVMASAVEDEIIRRESEEVPTDAK